VAVRLDEPGHQRRAGAVDHARVVPRQTPAPLNRHDALALDQHVSWKRRDPAAIENRGVGDQRSVHGLLREAHDSTAEAYPIASGRRPDGHQGAPSQIWRRDG